MADGRLEFSISGSRYDTLTTELLLIANANHGDGIVRPKLSYQWQDNLTTWVGADIFYGERQGVFGVELAF